MTTKILYLTLKKPQFQVTFSREKQIEYRKNGDWIKSRLLKKDYGFVKFTNGYGLNKPYFICEFLGWEYSKAGIHKYSNGLKVFVNEGDIAIKLGNIIDSGNIR
jgi:hypothetical protein